jgi:hypothetical protein
MKKIYPMQQSSQKDYSNDDNSIKAIAVFEDKKIQGTVLFTEDLENNCIIIDIDIRGLTPFLI